VDVPTGFHIFSDETLSVKLPSLKGVTWGAPKVPEGKMEEDRPVLRGSVRIEIPVDLTRDAPSAVRGKLELRWQACQEFGDKVCFLPIKDVVPFDLKVKAAPVAPRAPAPAEPPAAVPAPTAAPEPPGEGVVPVPAKGEAPPPAPALKAEGYEAKFARAAKENMPLALLLAFLFGVLSSLTPCVYPVIPITVAYIGSRSEGKGRSAGFFLSLAFVAGLALVYAVLGAVSAKAGQAFGALTQTPWVGLPIAALFFALSLSMFNLFEFKTPAALTNRIEATKRKGKGRGFVGAFLIGALSGLVASPCIGPLIFAILVVVAATGSVALGFLYLFVYALGLGVLFIVIGTFSGVLASLPRSGGWMDGVRVLFGALILAAAFYFAGLYLPKTAFLVVGLLALWAVVLFLLFGAKRHFFSLPMRVAGILLCAVAFVAVMPLLPSMARNAEGGVAWQTSLDAGLAAAKAQGKPALVDMRADWCVACVELEKKTWPDARVQKWLGTVVPIRLDMTKNTDADQAIMQRYGVKGLPTVLFLSPEGRVISGFVGYRSPEAVLAWAGEVQGKQVIE
jgi:thiol:disulfide interchange protein DsbD